MVARDVVGTRREVTVEQVDDGLVLLLVQVKAGLDQRHLDALPARTDERTEHAAGLVTPATLLVCVRLARDAHRMIRLQAQRAVVPGDRVLVPALEDEHLPQRQVAAYILRCQPDAPVQVRRDLLEVPQPPVDLRGVS